MFLKLYILFRLIVATSLLILGVGLTFGILPQKLRSTIFDKSRRIMGVAIMVLPIATILSYAVDLIHWGRDWNSLISLSAFYIISTLASVSFTSLLGNHIQLHSLRSYRDILGCIIFPIPILVVIIYGDDSLTKIMMTTMSIILSITIVYECITFYILYRKAIKRVNNYYSDDLEVNIRWLHNSALYMLSLGIICCISVLIGENPLWLTFCITLYRLFVFVYVFYSFIRFIRLFANMTIHGNNENLIIEFEHEITSHDHDNDLEVINGLGRDVATAIGLKLDEWVEKLKFTNKGITINSVSRDIATNRTYLSCYINNTFNCTFKVWVTRMRISEAKRLLVNSPELPTSEIASKVGFASTTSFSHAFKQIEGNTPIRWRQQNMTKEPIV